MARRPRKRPKAGALPPDRKHPRTAPGADPALHDRETIVWAFGIADLEGPWGWRTVTGRVWWDEILPKLMEDEFFAKVVESQKQWTRRVVYYLISNEIDKRLAFNHAFPGVLNI